MTTETVRPTEDPIITQARDLIRGRGVFATPRRDAMFVSALLDYEPLRFALLNSWDMAPDLVMARGSLTRMMAGEALGPDDIVVLLLAYDRANGQADRERNEAIQDLEKLMERVTRELTRLRMLEQS